MSELTNPTNDLLANIPLDASVVVEIGAASDELARSYISRNPLCNYIRVALTDFSGADQSTPPSIINVPHISKLTGYKALKDKLGGVDLSVIVLGSQALRTPELQVLIAGLSELYTPDTVVLSAVGNLGFWRNLEAIINGAYDLGKNEDGYTGYSISAKQLATLLNKFGFRQVALSPRMAKNQNSDELIKAIEPLSRALHLDSSESRKTLITKWHLALATRNPAASPFQVLALGLKKTAGVTEARVDYPMRALASLGNTRVTWGAGNIPIDPRKEPGVFILHRQFMINPALNRKMESLAAQGWILVADMDDDPRHWKEYIDSDFYAFRSVHAVTVSTPAMALLMETWNPNVKVFPNAIFKLPELTKQRSEKVRIFFGALNRENDWKQIVDGIIERLESIKDSVEIVVVHDEKFYQSVPPTFKKLFYPMLPHDKYLEVLESCDLALLPLNDTVFNRLKSDLKLIECCASGVVPVCSSVVYGDDPAHKNVALFADTAEEWADAVYSLCQNAERRNQLAKTGLNYVRNKRMHCHQVKERYDYYRSLMSQYKELEIQRKRRLELVNADRSHAD